MRRLSEAALAAAAEQLPHWTVTPEALVRVVGFDAYADGLRAVQALGEMAEALNHHPDLSLRWGRLEIRWSTHDAGGVTALDVAAAQQGDQLLQRLLPSPPAAG